MQDTVAGRECRFGDRTVLPGEEHPSVKVFSVEQHFLMTAGSGKEGESESEEDSFHDDSRFVKDTNFQYIRIDQIYAV